ncbi:MAG: pilin, partial [Patescibacteria group bacterium]
CTVKLVPGCDNWVPKATINPVIGPAPVTSPAPSTGGAYNLTPPSTTGGINDPIKNVGTAPITSGLIPCDNVTVKCDFNAFAAMINKIIDWFIGISITVATITFIIAGAKILTNPESGSEREAAKEMFKKTVIGLFIILTAWLIVNTIVSTLVDTSTGALRFLSN